MGYTTPANHGRSSTFRAAMSRSAERRRCPSCGRGAALIKESMPGVGIAVGCRWCDYRHFLPAIQPEPETA